MTDNRNDIGKKIKMRRLIAELTLTQLSVSSGVSLSYLTRIETGKRFPSARILRKIAKPLGIGEGELLILADYLSPSAKAERLERLDPYVAVVLSQESVEVQRAVVTILGVLRIMAKVTNSR